MSQADQIFMRRALQLARQGKPLVAPNPMVGCVIVHQGRIIGEGYHHQYGGAHAEVVAINEVSDKTLLKSSTLYVTLEPCSHYGKTPPCADLLVQHQVKRVVIAAGDPNPEVSGRGIKRLVDSGVEVVTGMFEEESTFLNKRFNTFHQKKRPYVVLKWAETRDGFVARSNYDSKWISGAHSRQLVHRWRTEEAAILVGKNTVKYDDPQLTARDWKGRSPIRIVLDPDCRLDDGFHVFDGNIKTYHASILGEAKGSAIPIKVHPTELVKSLLFDLYKEGIQSVLVEGGARTLAEFIESRLWDEARVFVGKQEFGEGIAAPKLSNGQLKYQKRVKEDTLKLYENHDEKY